ncbi:alpha/beta hydrolase [Sinomonas sp. JGH33]|uniref:Alpha/beta hydrolase n=1 Tax=Sinomonas terricola TaxID=3110330 RepID=A0ABU5TAN9_9MICC|nr:alpha/beta hydrolase [Sinomonas sp. JGH33]MEA5456766.1 alpha/beta hydrolase [Sinomonas sp. JGH33]
MPYADVGEVRLCYEASGPPAGEPLVLIHGLGAQLVAWYPGFCRALEEQGFRVIRVDNRDIGLSSKMDHAPHYTLEDMARDVVGLLDALGLPSAHVAGQSMGGMIAQILAASHPQRVRSLCVIYSAPSPAYLIEDDEEAMAVLDQGPAPDRESAIRRWIDSERISGLDGFDEEWVAEFAAAIYDRSYCPEGFERQARALRTCRDLTGMLQGVKVPTAVIHGRNDRLISFRGGIASALAIPDAELHVYSGMGHQVKPGLWGDFVHVIARTAQRGIDQNAAAPTDQPVRVGGGWEDGSAPRRFT